MSNILNASPQETSLIAGAVSYCEKALKTCKIDYGTVRDIKVNRRAKKRFGCCKANPDKTFSIEINENVFKSVHPEKSVRKVLLHEYCHTVPLGHGHKAGWKDAAEKLNSKYNIGLQRCDSYSSLGLEENVHPAKYQFVCLKCGSVISRNRASHFTRHPEVYQHSHCGGKISVLHKEESELC